MASANPNPTRISAALWGFWLAFDKLEPTVQYGGTYTPKPGYHSYASRLSGTDYSVSQVPADKRGSRSKASAIDLTMSAAAMVRYTKRLDAAARARDKRLYIHGVPILREFIGTKDNRTVYCYVLTGGRAQGVGADAGPDYGRDKSHLWHIHLSVIREFCESADAFERLFSVLSGELLAAWERRRAPVVKVTPPTIPAKPVKPAPAPVPAKPTVPTVPPAPAKPPIPAPAPARPVPPKPPAKPAPVVHRPGSREVFYVPNKIMTGPDVVHIQKWIGPARAGKADGEFGPRTRDAVSWYQGMRGLDVDGRVGRNTWKAMGVRATF